VRRWRHLDFGVTPVFLEAELRRVNCPEHGPTTSGVPWARHGAGHTRAFDDLVAWLAKHTDSTTIAGLVRTAWRTVGTIIARVIADLDHADPPARRMAGLRRIGIDEISYRKGQKYLTVVTDHDTGRMIWAAPGRDKATLAGFFDLLGPAGCARIELVSADGADWIADLVALRCPHARQCMDPFHVIAWAHDALDQVRRAAIKAVRATGDKAAARVLFRSRYALWKNPENLTETQQAKLDHITACHAEIHQAWQLKEQLRAAFAAGGQPGIDLLDTFYEMAHASGLAPFTRLATKMERFYRDICHTLTTGLSNARSEAINTHIRLITRRAYGFKSVDALLALIKLRVGGYPITLPGRT
jgi:transposase